MKNKTPLILLLSSIPLCSCGGNEDSSPHTDTIEGFLSMLAYYTTGVSSFSYEATKIDNYYAINVTTKQNGTKSLYNLSSIGNFIDDAYTQYVEDNEGINGEIQTYVKNGTLFELHHYYDEDEPDKKTAAIYDEELYPYAFDLSLLAEEKGILSDFQENYIGAEGYKTYCQFTPWEENGTFAYSYGVDIYRDNSCEQSIVYENSVTLKDGQIVAATKELTNSFYSGREVINQMTSNIKKEYVNSEPKTTFDGHIFDPNGDDIFKPQ